MKIKTKVFKSLLIVMLAFVAIGMIFAGCKSSEMLPLVDKEAGYYGENEVMMEEAPAIEEAPAVSATEDFTGEGRESYGETQLTDRMIIKSAYLELEVEVGEFEKILFRITNLAEQSGGFVSNTNSYSDTEGNLTSGSITIRIPHNKYSMAVDKIKEMGLVRNISISGQDVTQEYVDLGSRLKNLEAQEEILLELMEQSKNVEDSIEVQRELSYVQGDIEVIKGRMNYLDNMVSFSSIEIYLYEPEAIAAASDWGFMEAIRNGIRWAAKVFNGMITFLIVISPVLIIIAIILIIVWQVIRARKRRRALAKKDNIKKS